MKALYNNVGTFRVVQGSNGRFILQQPCDPNGRVIEMPKSTKEFDCWTKIGPYLTQSEAEAEIRSRHVSQKSS